MYGEEDITWSSIEKYYKYNKVVWHTCDNGIPMYTFMDEKGNKIKVNVKRL